MALTNYEYQSEFARNYVQKGHDEGREKGREEGALQAVAHLFERRLGRPLTEKERSTLKARVHELGIDRVSDAVLDLPTQNLAAWLA